jgi:hypothetical protein
VSGLLDMMPPTYAFVAPEQAQAVFSYAKLGLGEAPFS